MSVKPVLSFIKAKFKVKSNYCIYIPGQDFTSLTKLGLGSGGALEQRALLSSTAGAWNLAGKRGLGGNWGLELLQITRSQKGVERTAGT